MGLLDVIYRDADIVAINKPESLLVHRSRVSADHVAALQLVRDQVGTYVYPVHRLDRPTSGVLLFALNEASAARLQGDFAAQKVDKDYLAVVRGYLDPAGRIEHAFVEPDGTQPKESVTEYTCLNSVELAERVGPYESARYSLAAVHPLTGRTHQIRRHLKHVAHPIIGDTMYGDGDHNTFFREKFACHRLLLHACRVEFTHPRTGAPLRIEAPVPEDMARVLRALGWDAE